jgi:glycine/sarcosine N-methyltransferase
MPDSVLSFYQSLADHYHLIFDDWDESIQRQSRILAPILAREISAQPLNILDVACGIGTQSIGFAQLGHHVIGSDLSPFAIDRARREAAIRSLDIPFFVTDMTSLQEISQSDFDAVVALDNALPHLSTAQLPSAIAAIQSKLKPNGLFLASIRDYDQLIREKPAMQPPSFFGQPGNLRIIHQVWDWIDDTSYILHLFITREVNAEWQSLHFTSQYRCLLRNELSSTLASAGFHDIRWLMPAETGFYQPLVLASSPT